MTGKQRDCGRKSPRVTWDLVGVTWWLDEFRGACPWVLVGELIECKLCGAVFTALSECLVYLNPTSPETQPSYFVEEH
jgi:hypothetical protein